MENIGIPEITLPTEKDWQYFFSFKNPRKYFEEVERVLAEERRFLADLNLLKLLHWYSSQHEIQTFVHWPVRRGFRLKRARIYDILKDKEEKTPEFRGYGPEGSFVPPKNATVSAGRANPSGIIYLYSASDVQTAIAEVNPSAKDEVSVAEIEVKDDLKMLNFANLSASTVGRDNLSLAWKRDIPLELTRVFSMPQQHSDGYFLCQYISEYIKVLGYDGIRFASSKVKTLWDKQAGINYTIFNYRKCRAISSELYIPEDVQRILGKKINGIYVACEE